MFRGVQSHFGPLYINTISSSQPLRVITTANMHKGLE